MAKRQMIADRDFKVPDVKKGGSFEADTGLAAELVANKSAHYAPDTRAGGDVTPPIDLRPKLRGMLGLAYDADDDAIRAALEKHLESTKPVDPKPAESTKWMPPVESFQAKVAEKLKADPKIDVPEAQRRVAAEEPELYAATRPGGAAAPPRDRMRQIGGEFLAHRAREIATRDGVDLAEAQRRASVEDPKAAFVHRHGVAPTSDEALS